MSSQRRVHNFCFNVQLLSTVELNQEGKFMKLIHQALIAGCVLAAVGFAGKAQAAFLTFTAGRIDNFSTANGYEPATPSNLLRELPGFVKDRALMNFDEPGYDKVLAHTFTGLPTGIIAATLQFKAAVSQGGAFNDRIRLGFSSDPNPVGFFSFLGAGNFLGQTPSPGLLPNNQVWGTSLNQTANFTIALPPILIAGMNNKGYIDAWGEDDTKFDYFQLNVQTVPEPFTIAGTVLGLGGLFSMRRKRQIATKQNVNS